MHHLHPCSWPPSLRVAIPIWWSSENSNAGPLHSTLSVSLELAECISRVKELADLYEGDLPSPECLESELHSWHIKWQQQLRDHGESSLPTSFTLTLRHVSSISTSQQWLICIGLDSYFSTYTMTSPLTFKQPLTLLPGEWEWWSLMTKISRTRRVAQQLSPTLLKPNSFVFGGLITSLVYVRLVLFN